VERIWRCHSEGTTRFVSIAESRCELVVTRMQGKLTMTVRGPETRATYFDDCPEEGEWVGIRFKPGVCLSLLPVSRLVDTDLALPQATNKTFWLDSSAWQFPTYDNADIFVAQLVRRGLVLREPMVGEVLAGKGHDLSSRSVQRRFLWATGITQNAIRQIERARYAARLLQQGTSIFSAISSAGYYDQPHLTRALKYYIGQTPAQILQNKPMIQLSFLYKTTPFV
jgi:hypothetical protein